MVGNAASPSTVVECARTSPSPPLRVNPGPAPSGPEPGFLFFVIACEKKSLKFWCFRGGAYLSNRSSAAPFWLRPVFAVLRRQWPALVSALPEPPLHVPLTCRI